MCIRDRVEAIQAGRQTTVQAEDLILHDCRERQVVEQIGEVLPDVGIAVLAHALVVEAIHLGDLATLVIAAQDRDSVSESHLQTDEQSDSLDRVVASVDVVTHEEVVRVRRATSDLEELHKIVELAVHVSTDSDWAADGLHVALLKQDFLCLKQ